MVTWMCNTRPEDKISTKEIRIRLKLTSMRKCLQDKKKTAMV